MPYVSRNLYPETTPTLPTKNHLIEKSARDESDLYRGRLLGSMWAAPKERVCQPSFPLKMCRWSVSATPYAFYSTTTLIDVNSHLDELVIIDWCCCCVFILKSRSLRTSFLVVLPSIAHILSFLLFGICTQMSDVNVFTAASQSRHGNCLTGKE